MHKNSFFTFFIIAFAGMVLLAEPLLAQSLAGNPTSNHRQTSPFGWRTSTNSNHLAIDYGAVNAGRSGDPIYATQGGTVVESRVQINSSSGKGWGNTILVESASGNYRTRYSHLDSRSYSAGDTIAAGSQVGTMGDTGSPGSVHLDYAVYVKDPATGKFHAIDPAMAEGKNLDDPAVRQELIEDAKGKIDGELRSEGDPQGGNSDVGSNSQGGSESGGGAQQAGCNPGLLQGLKAKQQALQQQETEAAKALITKPTSVQQLTCFDQYTKLNSDKIGKIHSDPAQGISDTIVPIVEMPNLNNLTQNFLSGILGGGLQSMLSNAISSLGLGSIGGGGGSGNCPMMDQMWDLLQCVDFPKMPSLNDIMGGGGEMSGILSGLGSFGGGSGGIMGQVCSAVKGLMGGGGSGGTDAFENAANSLKQQFGDNAEGMFGDGRDEELDRITREVANGQYEGDGEGECNYTNLLSMTTDMRADLNRNNIIEESELRSIDIDRDCQITNDEIDRASGAS